MTKKTTATTTTTTDSKRLENPLMAALVDDLMPSLDEALAAYEASGTMEDFKTWNVKYLDDYMDKKISKRLENPTETAKPKTSKSKSKKAATKADKIPTVKVEIMEGQTSLIPAKPDARIAMLLKSTNFIRSEVDAISKSFCKIGFKLWEIKEKQLYVADNFKNISEYGELVLGFKKSSTANYIAICERFSKRVDGKPTSQLMDGFSNFSYGQLSVMLALPDEKVKDVTPNMSVSAVRKMKSDGSESDANGKSSADTSTDDMPVQIFSRTLTQANLDIVLKLLHENIGKEITIYVE